MNKKTLCKRVLILLVVILVVIINLVIYYLSNNTQIKGESWVAYFAPPYTDIAYGDDNAQIVEFNTLGNIKYKDEKAYSFSGIINYQDDIMYQNPKGVSNLYSKDSEMDIVVDKNTVGYNMADIIENKKLFYFLLNEKFKTDYYSSNIIIGDKKKQTVHQIEGFINGYGDDEDDIYLLVSDMKNRYLKQIKKLSVDNQEHVSIKKNDIILDSIIGSDNKMIIFDGYIYCFTVKERYGVSMLKISSTTLELESTIDLIKFDSETNNDKYYPISPSSIFYKEGKIYYPMLNGDVYSFDIQTSNFKKEFSINDYNFDSDTNIRSYYNNVDSEIYFLYYDKRSDKYCLSSYYLNGILKNKTYLNDLKLKPKMYPHSFIKSNK